MSEIADRLAAHLRLADEIMPFPLTGQERRAFLMALAVYEFFPERIPELEKALGPAIDAVDEAWAGIDLAGREIDVALLRELWNKTAQVALRKQFLMIQQEARARLTARRASPPVVQE